MGSSLTLTFFVMFRHARIIKGQDVSFNKKVSADSAPKSRVQRCLCKHQLLY